MALPQRVIVTGAAQGIGRAVALRLASPGIHLAVWDVKRDGVEETAKLCQEKGAAARAWAGYGIRVNCVIPGLTDTAQPRVEMGDNELYAAGARIPMGRIGRPEDIAAVVAFLLSDDAGYMTGQSVAANGGAIMVP